MNMSLSNPHNLFLNKNFGGPNHNQNHHHIIIWENYLVDNMNIDVDRLDQFEPDLIHAYFLPWFEYAMLDSKMGGFELILTFKW